MKAFELLDSKEKWLQRQYARDAEGGLVHSTSSKAACFCTIGAVNRAYLGDDTGWNDGRYDTRCDAMYKLSNHIETNFHCGVAAWNDAKERTYEEVVSLLKELDI